MLPNLFHFATSELSQDAVLCWLLSWADNKHREGHPHLHDVAKALLCLIYHRAEVEFPIEFLSIDIRKQVGGIDVLCVINNDMAILIEDKVGTKQHSDQLARYKDHVFSKLGFAADKVIPVYIQTGDQSDYIEVEKHGYHALRRRDLLEIFESESGKLAKSQSDIFCDFSDYMRHIEDDVQSFLILPLPEWAWNSWKGFYTEIQRKLHDGNWDYVANPAGGFLGFWWHFNGADECKVYLQLEQEKFCFKISVDNAERRRDLRQHWHEKISSKCPEYGLKAKRPDRFGNGQYMTVAILDQEYRIVNSDGVINMAETLEILKSAQSVIDGCLSTV
jgi:hypothetical protein